jgi:hypothetical protein
MLVALLPLRKFHLRRTVIFMSPSVCLFNKKEKIYPPPKIPKKHGEEGKDEKPENDKN